MADAQQLRRIRDEVEMVRLGVFMNNLLDIIKPADGLSPLDRALSCDIDLEKIRLHDTLHLKWPLQRKNIVEMIELFEKSSNGRNIPVRRSDLIQILEDVTDFYRAEANVTYIDIPEGCDLVVVGDIHGQLQDFLHILKVNGYPSARKWYLFNGDFVDRGACSIEVAVSILSFKLLYPDYVFINRGNHEDDTLTRLYGFQREVHLKYDAAIYAYFVEMFKWLPIAAVINSKVLVLHGGLFSVPSVKLDELDLIPRDEYSLSMDEKLKKDLDESTDIAVHAANRKRLIMRDLLWSDPLNEPGLHASARGAGVNFGPDVTKQFLKENELKLIIRSHQPAQRGFEWPYMPNPTEILEGNIISDPHVLLLLTVFSASNYIGGENDGAVIVLDSKLNFKINSYKINPMVLDDTVSNHGFRSIEDSNRDNLIEIIMEKKTELLMSFQEIDKENSGMINEKDWNDVMNNVLELDLKWGTLTSFFVEINDDGYMNYNSFLQTYLTSYNDRRSSNSVFDSVYANRRELEVIFRFFDLDGSGEISLEEFKAGCKALNKQLPKHAQWNDIEKLFKELDIYYYLYTNSDGSSAININEFLEAFRIVNTSVSPLTPE